MKRLFIIVEGQTEELFVEEVIRPYFWSLGLYDVTPVKIQTSKGFKGGFVSYQHLRKNALILLNETNTIVTTLVDFYRIPKSLPNYDSCMRNKSATEKVECLEKSMSDDIGLQNRFFPYVQLHEFEALLFSSSIGFDVYFNSDVTEAVHQVQLQFDNPEDINEGAETAPSKRLMRIISDYEKVNHGNIIALQIGIHKIMEKCPRFKDWIEKLIKTLKIN